MAFRIEGKVEGLGPLLKSLDGLPAKIQRKALRSAARKSASVVNKAAKANVGKGVTGQLKRSLGVFVKVDKRAGVVLGIVVPRAGFKVRIGKRNHDPRAIAHLKERGTKPRVTKRGLSRGAAEPKPFLYPAFAANEGRILGIFGEEIDKVLATV